MKSGTVVRSVLGMLWVATGLSPLAATAQAWPQKPVRWIVPFVPGGAVDVTTRTLAQPLGTRLGQQVIIDNRGGAGGNIGVELAAKAAPDGYTMVMATSGQIAINPHMYSKLPFDPFNDLVPVTLAAHALNVLCVHPSVPATSVKALIALAKSKPGELDYATGGVGASDHISAELFKSMAAVKMVHVPYKGGAPAMVDLLAGNVHLGFSTVATALGPIRAGRLRALGITSAKRYELLPDVPTIAEAGLPGYEAVSWYGTFVPANTPRDIVVRLNTEIGAIVQTPEIRRRLLESGILAVSGSPESFTAYVKTEWEKWGKVIRTAGIKAD